MLRYALLIGVGLAVLAPIAAAQRTTGNVEEARRHFEAGTAAFETGDYALALTEFQAAHRLTNHPDILFNIYTAAERDNQYEVAASALERYLAEGNLEADRRPVLEQRLARLRQRIARGPQAPAEGGVEAPPPEEEAAAGEETTPVAPPSETPAQGGFHPAGIGVLIAAGVLGLTFGGLAIGSMLEADSLKAGCGSTRSCSDGEVATLQALNIAADVSWATAAALGVVGVVLLFVLPPERSAAQTGTLVAPWASANAAGLAISGGF